ncbi:MAG: GNAT family N-acetyltransferase [Bacteroidota bacterium]
MSLVFRLATSLDALNIAALHAHSWQENYRGTFSDHYLDHEAHDERLATWTKRLHSPPDKQWVLLVEEGNELLGFVCVYLDRDEQWGSLLDNLHVKRNHKGKGIGRQLFDQARDWINSQRPGQPFYLFVLVGNDRAITVYEKWGGQRIEKVLDKEPDGSELEVYRYVWP